MQAEQCARGELKKERIRGGRGGGEEVGDDRSGGKQESRREKGGV